MSFEGRVMAVGSCWSWKPPRGGSIVERTLVGERAESGEWALRERCSGVGMGGARSFACISSRSFGPSSSRQASYRASSVRCSSRALPCSFK